MKVNINIEKVNNGFIVEIEQEYLTSYEEIITSKFKNVCITIDDLISNLSRSLVKIYRDIK